MLYVPREVSRAVRALMRERGIVVDVGDRIQLASRKVGQEPRVGVVTAVQGTMITVQWPSGEQSTVVPAIGSLTVLGREAGARRASSQPAARATRSAGRATTRPASRTTAKKAAKAPARKSPPSKAAGKRAPARPAVSKKAPAKKAPAKKAPVKKAAAKKKRR